MAYLTAISTGNLSLDSQLIEAENLSSSSGSSRGSMRNIPTGRTVSPDGALRTVTCRTASPEGGSSRLSGLHGWLVGENSRRVKSWWAARSGTDLHKLYMSHLQDYDGKFSGK